MREIKFRAWDKGRMIEPMGLLMRDAPQWLDKLSSEAILMQYTGLHDRNGKEIWEGDIIRILEDTYWLYIGDICEVEWDECGGWYPFADNYHAMIYPYGYNVEVIGNIYENPELIEVSP